MKSRALVILLVISLLLASCNFPGVVEPTETPAPPTETPLPPTLAPTSTPPPTEIPTVAPTATPSVPVVTPSDEPVNCRFGPGTDFAIVGALVVGNSAQISGKSAGGAWWQIQNPSAAGQKCWVAASVTVASGNLSTIGVVAAPTPFVTKLTLKIDPDTISVAGCIGPILPVTFKGTIEVNGPITVKWHFESQQGGSMPEQTTEFTAFGTKDVSAEYTPLLAEGDYWVRLIVTSPNSMTAEAKYKIDCP